MVNNKCYLVFHEDVYDEDGYDSEKVLIWKANKKYLLLEEYDDWYICENELLDGSTTPIEKKCLSKDGNDGLFVIVI